MGIYIYARSVDVDEVKNAFGSCDEKLLKTIVDDEYSEEDTNQAVEDIIFNRPYSQENYIYGYALIAICNVLDKGTPNKADFKVGFETDWVNKILIEKFNFAEDTQIESWLMPDTQTDFNIPPIEDFPMISILHKEQLQELSDKLSSVNITQELIDDMEENLDEDADDDSEEEIYMYEHILGIKQNIEHCLKNNLSLICFCH